MKKRIALICVFLLILMAGCNGGGTSAPSVTAGQEEKKATFEQPQTTQENQPESGYHAGDVAVIRTFLQQPGAKPDMTNAEILGWDINDPDTWLLRDEFRNSDDIQWTSASPKRIYHFSVIDKGLAGVMDFSGLEELQYLYCGYNSISEIKLSNCPMLKELGCNAMDVELTSLDVSECESLKELSCEKNAITSLDVSQCRLLESLYCNDNKLTRLDLSGLEKLTGLNCSNNQLKTLDLSPATSLEQASCTDNLLESLNTTGLLNLFMLECQNNMLEALDLSTNTDLKVFLKCQGNYLTSETLKLPSTFQNGTIEPQNTKD